MRHLTLITAGLAGCAALSLHAADPFTEGVRTTPALTPEQEQKTFQLPPGFEIQLVAAEPDIAKPMNLAFDNQGRIWVTDTLEYPFPATNGMGRDSIKILSDFGPDGRARKIQTFATGLNIPTGILPLKDGAIGWSIPNIWRFHDPKGEGKAESKERLYGPLGWERDTHGMDSSFRRGFDGWMYSTHGFNNNTTIKGSDGQEFSMNSGNTFRVRIDGTHADHYTWGQVNPFGLCFDPMGNLFSADCHSQPCYQLLRGGYYPSFGKPDDGLGFAPEMIFHDHGSTAIAGIVYYADDQWPAEYRENLFTGNVMTSRINRDRLSRNGTTRIAQETPDFLATSDPWFRPVDTQMGPDGALYMADFYNRIIGHYEVPLLHPGRDRKSGRIWRVVYKGKDAAPARTRDNNVAKLDVKQLCVALNDPNLNYRLLATHELADRGASVVPAVTRLVNDKKSSNFQKAHGAWVLYRLNALAPKALRGLVGDKDALVRVHALRIYGEMSSLTPAAFEAVTGCLKDADPLVRRTAAQALAFNPNIKSIPALLALRSDVASDDTHLLYAVRQSLRNQLRQPGAFDTLQKAGQTEANAKWIADVAVAVDSPEAAVFLLQYVQKHEETPERVARYLGHAAKFLPADQVGTLATVTRQKFANDTAFQLVLFRAIQKGFEARSATPNGALTSWGAELAKGLLNENAPEASWHNVPLEGSSNPKSPWILQKRNLANGKSAILLSSLPASGESLTGVLHSKQFTVPAQLKFYLGGHDGYTDKPAPDKNLVRLVDTQTGELLAVAKPPRNDVAQLITWDLSRFAGKTARLEIVDGDTGDAYAWLSAGLFEPALVEVPKLDPSKSGENLSAGAELAASLGLKELANPLAAIAANTDCDLGARTAAAKAVASFKGDPIVSSLASVFGDGSMTVATRAVVASLLSSDSSTAPTEAAIECLRSAPHRLQVALARSLASQATSAKALADWIDAKRAPASVLTDRTVQDKLIAALPNRADSIRALVKQQPAATEQAQKWIDARRGSYAKAKPVIARGAEVFSRNCQVCHQIGGKGNLVGPQLDGIGNRGLERICEDVLDPNRNVDSAFRTTLFVLKDGDVVSGLVRREEGDRIILADATGKENPVAKSQVQERRETVNSLMPENFGEVIPEADFHDLLAYLLSQRPKQ